MTNKGVARRKLRRLVKRKGREAFKSMNLLPKAGEALNAAIAECTDAMADFQSRVMGVYSHE